MIMFVFYLLKLSSSKIVIRYIYEIDLLIRFKEFVCGKGSEEG